jgi:uncharacterized protein
MEKIVNRLILFTRYPEPGKTKTRLIPTLGPDGAADLQRKMTEQIIRWARKLKKKTAISLEIRYEGGSRQLMQEWLGVDIPCRPQGDGDLGLRMNTAFLQAFQSGIKRAVLIGTDCPEINPGFIQTAFQALKENEIVLGPATDGGYYLIALKRTQPQLFQDIPWGTGEVLQKTLQASQVLHLKAFLLPRLTDIDRPEDLPVWEKTLEMIS